jgi:hypothetical protein
MHKSAGPVTGLPLPLLPLLCFLQDVFSLGCLIAELWLDGRAFFDLSRLLLLLLLLPTLQNASFLSRAIAEL